MNSTLHGALLAMRGAHHERANEDVCELLCEDDAVLDSWLASLTPDQFGHILDALARPRLESQAAAS